VRPLAEVAASLREQLAARAALAEARKAGTAALADSNTNMAWSAPMTLTRMRPLSLPPEAVKAIFKQSPKRLPVLLGVNTADGYRLYRLNGVRAGDEAAQHAERIREELRRMQAQSEVRAFVAAAKADLGVSIDAKVLGQTEAR
jgi:hypothetical protein